MMAPLSGLRVLTIEQYAAGPYTSMFLGAMGADIIKVEDPAGGDFARSTGPFFLGPQDTLIFQCFNFNKRSLALDLKTEEGRDVFESLVRQSDVVLNNLRGNKAKRLRLDYASLKSVNPAIICAHISAYGRDNSRADRPGMDYLIQGECGFMAMTGEPDGPPTRFGLSMVDYMTAMMMAFSIAATVHGVKSGVVPHGCDVDVSLMDAALYQLTYPGIWYLNEGHVTGRIPRGAHPSATPSQMQRSKDGWFFMMCQNNEFWALLLQTIGREDIGRDPRFIDMAARLANRAELTQILDDIFMTRTTADWVALLGGKLPIGPVYDLPQALDNPFLQETGMVREVPHPDRPDMRGLSNPIRLDGERLPTRRAPKLGEDTVEVLKALGRSDQQIDALRAAKAIGG
jgi:crotonobetainyl-CoA:carnitine CoA-transferase CaiB-like acyl-CoA transferase